MRNKPRFHVHGSAFKLRSSHRSVVKEDDDRRGTKSKMEKRRIRKRLEQMKGDYEPEG